MAAKSPPEKANLPQITILATGGTIAGSAASNTQMTGYQPGAIGIAELIAALPALTKYARVSGEQVCNIASHDLTDDIWLLLAKKCNQLLARTDVDGLVITHGTNTLEETAYFLNLTVKSEKPVVLVGSMRPATAISADGPLNLLNAVRLAGSQAARGKGVLVALNDEINSAREVTKTNTSNVATFKAPELGPLGYLLDGEAVFYRTPVRRHTASSEFDLQGLEKLPQVEIVYSHVNENRILVDALIKARVDGIVYAGMGMGAIHKNALPALLQAREQGIQVVRSSRTGSGLVPPDPVWTDKYHFLSGDNLNPQKARILLMLGLTKTKDYRQLQKIFNEY